MKVDMHVLVRVFSVMFSFLLGKDPGVQILSHRVGIYLTSKVTAKQFSKMIVPIYIPTRVKKIFLKLHFEH